MQNLFRKVSDTGMFLIRLQSDLPLWFIHSMYTKKTQKFEKGTRIYKHRKRMTKNFMYLILPLSAVGPRVLLESSLWKVRNIVRKNDSQFHLGGESDNLDVDVVKGYKNVLMLWKLNLVIASHKYFFLGDGLSLFVSIVLSEIEGQL